MDNNVNMNNLELMINRNAQKIILDRSFHSSAADEAEVWHGLPSTSTCTLYHHNLNKCLVLHQ